MKIDQKKEEQTQQSLLLRICVLFYVNISQALKDRKPEHDIVVTGYGIAKRTEIKNGNILNGILHINSHKPGTLSILWYDPNNNAKNQHYWNQGKCKDIDNGKCQRDFHCKFAHVDQALITSLKAKYVPQHQFTDYYGHNT